MLKYDVCHNSFRRLRVNKPLVGELGYFCYTIIINLIKHVKEMGLHLYRMSKIFASMQIKFRNIFEKKSIISASYIDVGRPNLGHLEVEGTTHLIQFSCRKRMYRCLRSERNPPESNRIRKSLQDGDCNGGRI